MSGISISFRSAISAYAQAYDLDLSDDAAATLETVLQSTMRVADDKSVSFVTGTGRTGTLDDALALYAAGTPTKASRATPSPSASTGSNATARALAANAAVREGRSSARLVEAESLVAEHGNPWSPRSISRTRQGLVTNLHPDLAARLRRQAGAQ
ncbi:hypothetical protein ASF33_14735 [Methylobacterium sp. Leaf92]|nr:hypothetical protein ASF33_14735 [Methylobacterium sp. Leaf92]